MEVQALTRFARMSPRKLREITREITGLPVTQAADLLRFIPRKSARLVAKTLKSAVSNAENNHNLTSDKLIVEKAIIEMGTPLRRFKAGPRGSGMPYRKRTAHIRIVVADNASN